MLERKNNTEKGNREMMVSLSEILENKDKRFWLRSIYVISALVLSMLLVCPPMSGRTICEAHGVYLLLGFSKQEYVSFLEMVKAPCNSLIYHKRLSGNWLRNTSLAGCLMKMVIYKCAKSLQLHSGQVTFKIIASTPDSSICKHTRLTACFTHNAQ